jgi:hypothetical protein
VSSVLKPDDAVPTEAEVEEFCESLERAQAGEAQALSVVRKMMEYPTSAELFGNLVARVERSFIEALAGKDLVSKEAITSKLERLRAELIGPNPSPIERLLVERIVTCWLQVQDADIRYAQAKDLPIKVGEYYQRRMNHAHKRYLSALKTLAVVRKLAVPVLQVNIAKKQVNVAGPCVAPESGRELP